MTAFFKIVPVLLSLASASLSAADDSSTPLLGWHFDGAKDEPGSWQGKAKVDTAAPGPRPIEYPTFDENNRAAYFPGSDAFLVVKDHEKGGITDIRFRGGESITIEAWVKVKALGRDHMAYLIGKGRHVEKGEVPGAEMNQNYALRVKGTGGGAQLGFLFTSENPADNKREWHRWWSDATFPTAGWHHVALTYTFGKADSIRGFIDGKPTAGVWDMGGATSLPPVTDADDLVIGTGYRRSTSESFSGWIDGLAIYREAIDPETLTSRYAHNAPPPPPPPVTPDMVPPGRVLMQISADGVPAANAWPTHPVVTETYEEAAFGFVDWPQKYVSTGVRDARPIPSHVRASAMVKMPPGKHRLLLRGRGAAKLSIDGKPVLETPFQGSATDGHNKVSEQDDYLDLGPDFRFAPPGNREKWAEFTSDGREHFVVMETMIGSLAGKSPRRPEFGETVVAISPEGSESWSVLTPAQDAIPYTDEGWAKYEAGHRVHLAELDAAARNARREKHAEYWEKRRAAAKDWLAEIQKSEPVSVPALPDGFPANNEIDHFIGARIVAVQSESRTAKSGAVDYFEQVEPLLKAKCYDCHQGGKAKGELRLDQHASALKGGESDGPAIIPGDPIKSALTYRVSPDAKDDIMPPKGDPLTKDQVAMLEMWIKEGAAWPQFDVTDFELTSPADDLSFLRRVTLDTVGVVPSEQEVTEYLAADPKTRRADVVDRLLADPRWADHWMGYWQDVLAENPNVINPTLNNTGPFRWWIYESLLDNKQADLFVTELVRMEGSERFGGPAGFGTASGNDVPMAAKGVIVSSAFLGVEMKCARCHDAPSNISKQEDLFELAAMLKEDPIKVPTTSSVPMDKIHASGRKALIEVTLKPGSVVKPGWPFDRFADGSLAAKLAADPDDDRDRLAALITAPQNERFAQVVANRVWQRLMGRGIVENLNDWEKSDPSHPELLKWLGREFVASGYDFKSLARLILNSAAYGRATDPAQEKTGPLYLAPAPRRLTAEQIVDSLFHATGKPFDVEEVSLDIDSTRTLNNSLSLGKPRRAWMLASTSNERDRPSLSLPRIQAVSTVMESFGWRGSRQDPVSIRDANANVLQPAIIANGTMGIWLTRLSDDHGVTQLASENQPLENLIDRLFLRLLTRKPTPEEKAKFTLLLSPGYGERIEGGPSQSQNNEPSPRVPERYVAWSNHLDSAANLLAQEKETAARRGDPPTTRFNEGWRLRMEDVLWALLNSPEWIYSP